MTSALLQSLSYMKLPDAGKINVICKNGLPFFNLQCDCQIKNPFMQNVNILLWFLGGYSLLSQTLSVKENKPPIVNTQCIVLTYFNVICAMQIMSGTLPDTYIYTY